MDIISILYALISLAVAVGVIYLIIWVLGKLNIVLPENILRIIWVILVLLTIIWIIEHFFGGNIRIGMPHRR
jgi:hypothetical protein